MADAFMTKSRRAWLDEAKEMFARMKELGANDIGEFAEMDRKSCAKLTIAVNALGVQLSDELIDVLYAKRPLMKKK